MVILYQFLLSSFNDLAQGKLPFSPPKEEEEIPELQEDDIERAVQRLDEFNEELEELEEESEDGECRSLMDTAVVYRWACSSGKLFFYPCFLTCYK